MERNPSSIVPLLQIANAEDVYGDPLAHLERCRHLPSGEYDLCPFGVRLYCLYRNSQRVNTGGRVPPCWDYPYSEREIAQNTLLERARFVVQMQIIRPAYIAHVTGCCAEGEHPAGDILLLLTEIAKYLVQQNLCEAAGVPGSSLTYWYTRRGDPITMQELYIQEKKRRTSDDALAQ